MLHSEEHTFQQIMQQHTPDLLKVAYLYVKDWQAAEDIVQDTFFTYYAKFEQFEERASLKTYLTRITINKCKDYLKSWRYRKFSLTNQFFGTKKDRAFAIEQSERLDLAKAVMEMPIQLREVIIHYYYEEMSVLEVAELLGIPDNTVKTRLRKARQVLKTKLTSEEWEVLAHE
jgi:RNA polymerase sigma factor (sigma-70 family)